jgi:hypothetical protein
MVYGDFEQTDFFDNPADEPERTEKLTPGPVHEER